MIFHTACDDQYFETFYKNWFTSIRCQFPMSKTSLHYISDGPYDMHDAALRPDIFVNQQMKLYDIKRKYRVKMEKARGYFCMARWMTIPLLGEHVAVTDIDIKAIGNQQHELVEDLLLTHDVVNCTRLKLNGTEGGMMVVILNKEICEDIRSFAIKLLDGNELTWGLDTAIMKYIHSRYKVANLHKMHNVADDSISTAQDKWFAFFKTKNTKLRDFKAVGLKRFGEVPGESLEEYLKKLPI